MPLISKDHAPAYSQGAIVLDLGDLQRQGDAIIERARREAEAIVEEAKQQRDRLLKGASEYGRIEGFAQGKLEGLEEGRSEGKAEAIARATPELAALTDRWAEALGKFESDRLLLLNQANDNLLEFATTFAQRVTKRAVSLDRSTARAQVEAALGMLLHPSRIVVVVHPDDRALVDEAMPELLGKFDDLAHAELLTDESLSQGSCVIRSGAESVEADIERQIERLVEAVLPDRAVGGADGQSLEDAA